MKNLDSAKNLAENLIRIGGLMGRDVRAIITDMNQPLGSAVGNLLEVLECIEFLDGSWPEDLYNVTMELSAEMLTLAGIKAERDQAIELLKARLEDGSALRKFQEMVEYQKGDLSGLSNVNKKREARYVVCHKAEHGGYLQRFHTYEIGRLVIELGGGRATKEDVVDLAVGFKFYKKIGDEVSAGEMIAEIHANDKSLAYDIDKKLSGYIELGEDPPVLPELIKERLD
jgi:pyrimidine-nucleoside phosphorylase